MCRRDCPFVSSPFLKKSGKRKLTIFESPIIHSVAPQILHKLLCSNALGKMQYSQEHFKTMVYAEFGGQTECIMGNSKIEDYKGLQKLQNRFLLLNFI